MRDLSRGRRETSGEAVKAESIVSVHYLVAVVGTRLGRWMES